ncbi:MAG TPA: hypothetical protein VGL46_21565 [Pseudonocardiaceae bacterium]|jgi:hypothetical protein
MNKPDILAEAGLLTTDLPALHAELDIPEPREALGERVRTGAALLDEVYPGWRGDLLRRLLADQMVLRFDDLEDGVLTRLFGSHERGVREVFAHVPAGVDRGMLAVGCGFEGYHGPADLTRGSMEAIEDYIEQLEALAELWTAEGARRSRG